MTLLLIAVFLQIEPNSSKKGLSFSELRQLFPQAELLWPTDPPRSFNFDTERWSTWPMAHAVLPESLLDLNRKPRLQWAVTKRQKTRRSP